MSVIQDSDDIVELYESVRDDNSDITWCACVYDHEGQGKEIVAGASGSEYSEFLDMLTNDAVVYGYVRVPTGSTVTHFAFITWIGPAVSPLKKAKVSTDKAFVKQLTPSFAKEILADNKADLDYDKVMQMLAAASGAAYSTGR